MSRRNRWWLPVLISLLVVGSWGCCTLKCRESTARVVDVSSTDTVPVDTIRISKKAHQQIVWKLPADSTISNVAISLAGKPAPFENCVTSADSCRIPCCNHSCVSGSIQPSLEVPPDGIYYAYAFARPEGSSSDPGIRIDP